MQLLAINVCKGELGGCWCWKTKPTHATPRKLPERRAISVPEGGNRNLAEASAFSLPSSFLNVIWDKLTSDALALFLICRPAEAARLTKWPDVISGDRSRTRRGQGARVRPELLCKQSLLTEAATRPTGYGKENQEKYSLKTELCWGPHHSRLGASTGTWGQTPPLYLTPSPARKYRHWLCVHIPIRVRFYTRGEGDGPQTECSREEGRRPQGAGWPRRLCPVNPPGKVQATFFGKKVCRNH